MFLKKKLLNEKILLIIIFLSALLINQFSGNRGIYPVDSFGFFDSGFRVLNGEYPFKDYWIVSGPFIDYFQALLFSIFGANWQSYILQSSLLNAFLSVITFKFLREFDLDLKSSFFYTICLSVLAYPSSGTPFVDHHATFLSLIGIYFLILGIKKDKKTYWLLLPFILGFAFLSKQVPTAYLAISIILMIGLNFLSNDKNNNIRTFLLLLVSSIIFLSLVLLIFIITDTSIKNFFEQYFFYPSSIGESRYGSYKINFNNLVHDFKFIHLAFLPFFIINFIKIIKIKKYYEKINCKLFLIFLLTFISLALHQIFTKNQIFIFFLIPLFTALSHIEINVTMKKNKWKKILIFTMLTLCFFSTIKYHQRFNLEKKFHELSDVNFKNSIPAKKIDYRFLGLNWITPGTVSKDDAMKELTIIESIKLDLKKDKRKKMLITHYAFFSILLNEDLNAPSRWYPMDGTGFPVKGSNFYLSYVKFLKNLIINKKIEIIYITADVSEKTIFNYLNKDCFEKKIISSNLTGHLVKKNCKEFK